MSQRLEYFISNSSRTLVQLSFVILCKIQIIYYYYHRCEQLETNLL